MKKETVKKLDAAIEELIEGMTEPSVLLMASDNKGQFSLIHGS